MKRNLSIFSKLFCVLINVLPLSMHASSSIDLSTLLQASLPQCLLFTSLGVGTYSFMKARNIETKISERAQTKCIIDDLKCLKKTRATIRKGIERRRELKRRLLEAIATKNIIEQDVIMDEAAILRKNHADINSKNDEFLANNKAYWTNKEKIALQHCHREKRTYTNLLTSITKQEEVAFLFPPKIKRFIDKMCQDDLLEHVHLGLVFWSFVSATVYGACFTMFPTHKATMNIAYNSSAMLSMASCLVAQQKLEIVHDTFETILDA